jgi:CRP-like cAMP-binding protein
MISPELLRRYPYFAKLGDESLKTVALIAEEVAVPAGTRMFGQGDPANYLYIIIKGELNIQYLLCSGQMRTVDTLVDGDLLIWSALIEPYRTTAIGTTTKDCRLIRISAAKLRELCSKDPAMGYQLTIQVAKLLAHRLEGARIQLAAVD